MLWPILNIFPVLQQTCLLSEEKRCRSLEDLRSTEPESRELKEFVRINSIRKTKSVDDILREQLEEVKEVMHLNLVKIRDRNGKLDDLVEKGNMLTGSVSCLYAIIEHVPISWNYILLWFPPIHLLPLPLPLLWNPFASSIIKRIKNSRIYSFVYMYYCQRAMQYNELATPQRSFKKIVLEI